MLAPTSERLTYRPFTSDDAAFLLDMWSREEVWRYSGGPQAALSTIEEAQERIDGFGKKFTHPWAGMWIVERDGVPVGRATCQVLPLSEGASPQDEFTGEAEPFEIGWHVHPDHWNHRYGTEMGRALVALAFSQGVPSLIAVTHPDNAVSQAVAHRVGMVCNGTSERYYDQPVVHFSIANNPK